MRKESSTRLNMMTGWFRCHLDLIPPVISRCLASCVQFYILSVSYFYHLLTCLCFLLLPQFPDANTNPRVLMAESEAKGGVLASVSPLTWTCPEGHVLKYRRRPLLSSCIFIFCFYILERAAMYMLKTFLYLFFERNLNVNPFLPTLSYLLIAIFYGLQDMLPIFGSILTDGYLGGYNSVVIFGFMFVFGLAVSAIVAGGGSMAPTGLVWCSMLAMFGLVAMSAGTLSSTLTSFGGQQFHPTAQVSSGSRFFSLMLPIGALGSIVGIFIAIIVYASYDLKTVVLSTAIVGGIGYFAFLSGSLLYVKRCIHSSNFTRNFFLVWDCIKSRSFEQNKASNGGKYQDKLIDEFRLMARLLPIFACLIPLYAGQLQVLTTFRSLGYRLWRPTNVFVSNDGKYLLPQEVLLLVEPVVAVILSLVLNHVLWPLCRRFNSNLPTHLTRLVFGAFMIAAGFFASYGFTRYLQTSFTSESQIKAQVSIFNLVPMLVLFSLGQSLIMSSGYELSYSHSSSSLKSVSVSLFLVIYSIGSIFAIGEFAAFRPYIDEPGRSMANGLSMQHSLVARYDVYFLINGCFSLVSVIALISLRRYHNTTRAMKIDADLCDKMMSIALGRVLSSKKSNDVEQGETMLVTKHTIVFEDGDYQENDENEMIITGGSR
jgi:hypothetical protein